MKPIVTVTGATGFIGQYVVRQLVTEDRAVRVLARQPNRLPPDLRARVEVVAGDIQSRAALTEAVQGADTVLHLAACARAWSRDPFEFRAVNEEAVGHLLSDARRFHVRRFVHVSSIVTRPPYRPAPVRGPAMRPTPYEESKRAGEQLVEDHAASGHHAVIVHPTRVYGPGPLNDANGVTQVVWQYLNGRFRFRLADNDVQASYVHAEDVARGIVAAADLGMSGEHYILGGENATFRELLERVDEVAGVHHRTVALPPWAALGVARGSELVGRIGGHAVLTPSWVRCFLEDRRVNIDSTRAALNYHPRPLREGLADTIAWLHADAEGRKAA